MDVHTMTDKDVSGNIYREERSYKSRKKKREKGKEYGEENKCSSELETELGFS